MSDEPKYDGHAPDPLRDIFESNNQGAADANYPAPLAPANQQFSSRREARDAAGSTRKPASRKASTGPKPRTTKLSRRDQAAVKKLAATPVIAPAPVPPSRGKKRNPLQVFFVLLVIAGFVGGVALPAAATASQNNDPGVTTAYKNAQSVTVKAGSRTYKITRDAVTATTPAELAIERLNARELSLNPGPRQPGDDYPWRDAGYGLSPLNYYYRQCVDFVAWRLNRDAGVISAPWKWTWSTLTPWGGDASQWKEAWVKHGWTVSHTPIVGSVAWFVGDHVAYVHSISGSNVTIEEYNGENSRAYAMRTIPTSSVGDFLYPPP